MDPPTGRAQETTTELWFVRQISPRGLKQHNAIRCVSVVPLNNALKTVKKQHLFPRKKKFNVIKIYNLYGCFFSIVLSLVGFKLKKSHLSNESGGLCQ